MEEMAERILEMLMQAHIRAITDLYREVPEAFNFSFLAALKVVLDALLPTMSDHDRELYEGVLNASEVMVILLPRPKEREEDQ